MNKIIAIGGSSVISLAVGSVVGYIYANKRLSEKYLEVVQTTIDADRLAFKAQVEELNGTLDQLNKLVKKGPYSSPQSAAEHLLPQRKRGEQMVQEGEGDISDMKDPQVPRQMKLDVDERDVNGIRYRRVDYTNISPEAKKELHTAAIEALAEYRAENPERTREVIKNVFEDAKDRAENPYVISADEFLAQERDDHTYVTLTYYEGDGVLTDEQDEVIDEVMSTIGDNLGKWGEQSKDPNAVYIRNERLATDIELIRSKGAYIKDVLGRGEIRSHRSQ
jgi:hypothetical protein